MIKLNLPLNADALDELKTALTLDNGIQKYAFTKENMDEVQLLYQEYEDNLGSANNKLKATHVNAHFLKAIKNGYDEVQDNGRLKYLRSRILLSSKMCPCCGLMAPDQIDHYLPKIYYPALAVYSSNLIPYCGKCNRKKGQLTGVDPSKRFIHAYYDEIPNNFQFLFAKASIIDGALKIEFEIRDIPELKEQFRKQLNFQLARVEFGKRAMKDLNTFTSSFSGYVKSDFERGGAAAVRDGLLNSLNINRASFGLNSWRPAILEALAENDEFCNGGFYTALALD